eukprot:GILJ01004629.1.p1 GENE.GILJ01004629.1~~GILJ01004629.1.p1  ORF type:complete len:621 (+),score=76.85 GILJ01004629.1:94-1956(+)
MTLSEAQSSTSLSGSFALNKRKGTIDNRFSSYAAEGDALIRREEWAKAVEQYTKALEIRPTSKYVLLARSKAYLKLGEHRFAVEDADKTLVDDKNFYRGLYQKAEALFSAGNFEFALVNYHRGARLRPDLHGFRLGIQKSKEAIEVSFSSTKEAKKELARRMQRLSMSASSPERMRIEVPSLDLSQLDSRSGSPPLQRPQTVTSSRASSSIRFLDEFVGASQPNKPLAPQESTVEEAAEGLMDLSSRAKSTMQSERILLGELYADKKYLIRLLEDDTLADLGNDSDILVTVNSGLKYIKTRAEFWRQRNPYVVDHVKKVAGNASMMSSRLYPAKPVVEKVDVSIQPQANASAPVPKIRAHSANATRSRYRNNISPLPTSRPVSRMSAPPFSTHNEQDTDDFAHALDTNRSRRGDQREHGAAVKRGPSRMQREQDAESEGETDPTENMSPEEIKRLYMEQTRFAMQVLESISDAMNSGDSELALRLAKGFLTKLPTMQLPDRAAILGNVFTKIGDVYAGLGRWSLAALHYRKDLEIALKFKHKEPYRRALSNLAITYENLGDFEQAANVLEKRWEAATDEEKPAIAARIADCHARLGNKDAVSLFRDCVNVFDTQQLYATT